MAATTHLQIHRKPQAPSQLWAFFAVWAMLLMLLAAAAAPAVHAEPAAPEAKVFGEQNNMNNEAQPEAIQDAQPQAAADAPAEATNKPAYLSEDQPLQLKDYEDPKPAAPAPWWQQVLGFVFKLAMVIGLIAASLVAVKKLSGGRMALNLPNTKGRNIVVLESTHLNPQQAIHMISLGGERLLVVGAGPGGLSTLTEITDPTQVRHFLHAQKSTTAASAFNQVFDLERVVQDGDGDLVGDALHDVDDPRYRRGWSDR